jgi:hypothetical protein
VIVSELDARGDRAWFAARPRRRFRKRFGDGAVWLVRYRPSVNEPEVFLRVLASSLGSQLDDADSVIGAAWFKSVYPDWPAHRVADALRRALTRSAAP